MSGESIAVVKIGGSTLGSGDTTIEDLVHLQGQGLSLLVVHGGGDHVSRWLDLLGVETRFVNGLRRTDADVLPVVVAVLAGLVNKELVGRINGLGGRASGLSGADASLLRARRYDPELEFVGEVTSVDAAVLRSLLTAGYMPVIASIALEEGDTGQLLNVNADTVAGEVARALAAETLVFLTNVPGVLGPDGQTLSHLQAADARSMIERGIVDGGMIPKVEACLRAAAVRARTLVVDGRRPGALRACLSSGEAASGAAVTGTAIGEA
jgi:acetylglutamate kinase